MMFDDSVGLILIVCWRLARPVTDGPRVIQTGKWDRDRDRGDVGEGGGGRERIRQRERLRGKSQYLSTQTLHRVVHRPIVEQAA